jgi:hypothetical protein
MSRVPDRFDLWLRKARDAASPERQIDLILGAVIARNEVYFVNVGTKAAPRIARTEIAPHECALLFSDAERIIEFAVEHSLTADGAEAEPPIIASPTPAALRWCVESGVGALFNPGVGESAMVPPDALAAFLAEWNARGGRQRQGFWIPNMTSAEEDFWQENGL